MGGDAMRLAQRIDRVIVEIGNGLAHQLVSRAGIEFQIARQHHGVGARLLQGFAHIAGFHLGQGVDARLHDLAHARQDAAPFGGVEGAPCAVERILRGLDRLIDIVGGAGRHGADGLAGGGIFDGKRGFCGPPTARDEELFVDHAGILMAGFLLLKDAIGVRSRSGKK